MHRFNNENEELSYDIVLKSKKYKSANIFTRTMNFKDMKIERNSVGVIPNLNVIERANQDIYTLYHSLIDQLVSARRIVYILRHSHEDLWICKRIKDLFPDNKNIRLISDDLNAIELESILKQFQFVVASRYHSIVHSYKNGVPALVVGWATKYLELLDIFNQRDYFFECRKTINTKEIKDKLTQMMENHNCEREKIISSLKTVNRIEIFGIFCEEL